MLDRCYASFREPMLETVWKIAEGLSRVVHRRLETADRAPSTPIGHLRDPYFGIHPTFPNSFSGWLRAQGCVIPSSRAPSPRGDGEGARRGGRGRDPRPGRAGAGAGGVLGG